MKDKNSLDLTNPTHIDQVPQRAAEVHAENLAEKAEKKAPKAKKNSDSEQLSLNDDRRVKVLSPGAMVSKRFFRNRLAVTGLTILIIMFIFSFIGGAISPYGEDEQFYRYNDQNKEYAGVTVNDELRFAVAEGKDFGSVEQSKMVLAVLQNSETFEYKDVVYRLIPEGTDFYSVTEDGSEEVLCMAYKDIVNAAEEGSSLSFKLRYDALKAFTNGETEFESDGVAYTIDENGGIFENGTEKAYISRYVVQAIMPDVFLSRDFKEQLAATIEKNESEFIFNDTDGTEHSYNLSYDPASKTWAVSQLTETYVFDTYSAPSKAHWLGTDRNGMDMLTRLMYGGRVSLIIGFIVVAIETVIGIILGGIAGYFGGWIDNLIMRIVDIFYCIPSMPIIIILGGAMDAMRVDPQIRMLYLMLILGILGWAGIARMVRGQILSLREQEFMTATEACGIRVSRRIFRHLIPNVIPQLIVMATMGLGSTIITEATLSFLGLGVKFPFASWGNIINDVNDTFVLTTYWFIWIPAGVCLLLTVLAFNLVGDGLRDAFDPKMKR